MKLISSLVRPQKVDAIKVGLDGVNVFAMTVAEVRDHAPQPHETTVWRGHEYNVGSSLKTEIRILVHDDDVDDVVEMILRVARTGKTGDGHICVTPVEHRYDI